MKEFIKILLRETLDEERKSKGIPLKEESLYELLTYLYDKYGFNNVYVSFRDSLHVSKINPKNYYNTPTGLYAYNLNSFLEKPISNISEFRDLFPFASGRKYIQFLVPKKDINVLTSDTSENQIKLLVQKLLYRYQDNEIVTQLCYSFFDGTYKSSYTTPKNPAHKLWLFLYDVAKKLDTKNQARYIFSRLAREIGIDAFQDNYCDGWIHPNEKCQTVFLRSNLFEDIRILSNNFSGPKFKPYTPREYSIKDIDNIINKYGFRPKIIADIINATKTYQEIIKHIFSKYGDRINPIFEWDNLLYNTNRNKKDYLIKFLLRYQLFIDNITPKTLEYLIDEYDGRDVKELIYNNDSIISKLTPAVMDSMLYNSNYRTFFVLMLTNPIFVDKVSKNTGTIFYAFDYLDNPEKFYNVLSDKVKDYLQTGLSNVKYLDILTSANNPKEVYNIFKSHYEIILNMDGTPNQARLKQFLEREGLMNEPETMNENITNLIRESVILLEREFNGFHGSQLTPDEVRNLYTLFYDTYTKSMGNAWSLDKFSQRIQNWKLYGNDEGFITARTQRGGLIKLTGAIGTPRGILSGLNDLISTNEPIWGIVTTDIASMLKKKGFIVPNKYFTKIVFNLLPSSVIGADIHVNDDGTLRVTDSEVGTMSKVFVANKLYFKDLLTNNFIADKLPNVLKLWIKTL